MSRVWVSRIMGGAASVALAAAVLAAPLAASPPECTKGSCPTSITGKLFDTIPGLSRLLGGEGSTCDSACQTAVFELVQTADGFKLQPVESGTCTTACAKTCQEETAPTFSPAESFVAAKIACGACDKAKCSTAACKDGVCSTSACSKTACATSACAKTACAKEACQSVCAKVAGAVSTCGKATCAVSACAKGECAKTCAAKCSTAKCSTATCAKTACAKGQCAASCKAACATAACAKTACSKSACASTCSQSVCAKGECAKTCAAACKTASCAKACSQAVCAKACSVTSSCKCDAAAKCCAACKCNQGTSDKTTACETGACGKLCGVIDINRCEVTGDATVSQLWRMASAHCPLFNGQGGEKPAMVPAAVAQLEAKIAALETKLETYESVTEQREALYESLIHIQKEASDNKAAMTELVFTAMFQALEAKAQAAEENLAEYRRIIEEAAEVHVTNAELKAKLEAAEAKLELVHTLARLQLENDRLKQQLAAKTSQGEALTSSTCPVTTTATAKTIGTCTTGAQCTSPSGTCTTTTCKDAQPQILPVPPTRLTATTTAAPQQFAVHIRLYQETADQTTKQLAAPVILTAAGRKFSLMSGGVIQAGGTDTELPLGTQVEGCLGKCTSDGVELDLSIRHCVQTTGTTQAATVVSQCGGQIAGCIPLGKAVCCTLSQPSGQPICVEIKIEPACAPEVAEQR